MDDLIFRGAAIEAMTADNLNRNLDSVHDDDMKRAARAAQRALARLPAADVRPVVLGGWKPNPRNPYWLVCTVCGYGKPERTVYNFCPNCGADMREEP